MRKIPKELENPIDNTVIYIAELVCPYFEQLNCSANCITTIGFLLGVISCALFILDYNTISSALYLCSYVFDCLDGFYARKTNTCTPFGDMYDHMCDILKTLMIIVSMVVKSQYDIIIMVKLITIVVLAISMVFHISIQESNATCVKKINSPYINLMSRLCRRKEYIHVSKYGGCGTFTLAFCIILCI